MSLRSPRILLFFLFDLTDPKDARTKVMLTNSTLADRLPRVRCSTFASYGILWRGKGREVIDGTHPSKMELRAVQVPQLLLCENPVITCSAGKPRNSLSTGIVVRTNLMLRCIYNNMAGNSLLDCRAPWPGKVGLVDFIPSLVR